jgi:hypothetical protein
MSQRHEKTNAPSTLSSHDLAALGLETLAFIKPVMIGRTAAYAIHAADGEQLAIAADRAAAIATVRHNEMEPASVH